MKIKVTYEAPINHALDMKIRKALEAIGAKWIGQGTNFVKNIRDISFDIDEAKCDHNWVDATNEVIQGGKYCTKCHTIKAD